VPKAAQNEEQRTRAWFDQHGWRLPASELRAALQERGVDEDLVIELIDEGADRRRAGESVASTNGRHQAPVPAAPAGQVPPQHLEAEEHVLGAMMLAPGAIVAVRDILEPGDFYRESHGKIYRAALALHDAGDAVDSITLTAELDQRGELDGIGGRVRIHVLAALVPASANAAHYARIVHRHATLRGVIRLGGQAAELGWASQGDATAIVDQVREMVDELERHAAEGRERIRIVSSDQFLQAAVDQIPVLLGTATDKVLPAYGLAIVYGKGAAGKTTLTMTAVAALASATPWLGIPVPSPARILMVENEGPKAPFVEKIQRFADQWEGPDFLGNIVFYEEPWGRFSLADRGMRDDLLDFTRDQRIDLVVAGPLRGLGMSGPGAPAETDAFMDLLKEAGLGTELAWWIVHHVNKAGQVSGDFDRHPDTLIRYAYEGKRRNKLTWEKIRWGDQGREPLVLEWLDQGVGYTIIDTTQPDVDWAELERPHPRRDRRAPRLHPERRLRDRRRQEDPPRPGHQAADRPPPDRRPRQRQKRRTTAAPPRRRTTPGDTRRPVPAPSRRTERSSNGDSTGSRVVPTHPGTGQHQQPSQTCATGSRG
jgi:hypothetical protein